jgi:hypothetical protein
VSSVVTGFSLFVTTAIRPGRNMGPTRTTFTKLPSAKANSTVAEPPSIAVKAERIFAA